MEKEGWHSGEEAQFEDLIQGLITQDYGCGEGFLEEETLLGLRENLMRLDRAGTLHRAGIGRISGLQQNAQVRKAHIQWLEKDTQDAFERRFFQKVESLIAYLNRTCFTALNDYEFHYACYEPNSFYKRHREQFQQEKGRKFSLVLYLNQYWQETEGGKLSLST